MTWRSCALVSLVFASTFASAQGGIIFNRSKKSPSEQVADSIKTLRTDSDERHRASAADELSRVDGKAYPAAVQTLIESTIKDSSPAVRLESAQALGKVRPVYSQTITALEYAATRDSSSRVQSAAKSALGQIRVNANRNNAGNGQTSEPGLAPTAPHGNPSTANRSTPKPTPAMPTSSHGIRIDLPSDPPEPVAPAPSTVKFGPAIPLDPPAAKPMPVQTPPAPAAAPTTSPTPSPKPVVKPDDDGPILNPPM